VSDVEESCDKRVEDLIFEDATSTRVRPILEGALGFAGFSKRSVRQSLGKGTASAVLPKAVLTSGL